jgi:hypothetical protein
LPITLGRATNHRTTMPEWKAAAMGDIVKFPRKQPFAPNHLEEQPKLDATSAWRFHILRQQMFNFELSPAQNHDPDRVA